MWPLNIWFYTQLDFHCLVFTFSAMNASAFARLCCCLCLFCSMRFFAIDHDDLFLLLFISFSGLEHTTTCTTPTLWSTALRKIVFFSSFYWMSKMRCVRMIHALSETCPNRSEEQTKRMIVGSLRFIFVSFAIFDSLIIVCFWRGSQISHFILRKFIIVYILTWQLPHRCNQRTKTKLFANIISHCPCCSLCLKVYFILFSCLSHQSSDWTHFSSLSNE